MPRSALVFRAWSLGFEIWDLWFPASCAGVMPRLDIAQKYRKCPDFPRLLTTVSPRLAGTCARHPAGTDGGSGTDRMRASVVTVKRPTSAGPAANSRARWLWMYSGDLAWILRNTIPGGVGSRRRNTSSPKSRSKVMTTRCWAAPNASTSSSGAPGHTDRTGTTSCPSACRPRTASKGTFSSARKRG